MNSTFRGFNGFANVCSASVANVNRRYRNDFLVLLSLVLAVIERGDGEVCLQVVHILSLLALLPASLPLLLISIPKVSRLTFLPR
jgi:hypothetical protein